MVYGHVGKRPRVLTDLGFQHPSTPPSLAKTLVEAAVVPGRLEFMHAPTAGDATGTAPLLHWLRDRHLSPGLALNLLLFTIAVSLLLRRTTQVAPC